MHSTVLSKGIMFKWAIPIVVVAALLIGLGLIVSGGSSEGGLGDAELTDFNPAYQSDLVGPAEGATGPGGVYAIYSIDLAEPTSIMTIGAGTLATVTVTNNIPEPIANGTVGGVTVSQNGDILGNVVLYADVYKMDKTDLALGMVKYTDPTDGTNGDVVIANIMDVTVHPGKSATFQVPVISTILEAGTVVVVTAHFEGATLNFVPPAAD